MSRHKVRIEAEFTYGEWVKYRNPENPDTGMVVSLWVRENNYVEYGVMWSDMTERNHNAAELELIKHEELI